jgi:hypothetical protein
MAVSYLGYPKDKMPLYENMYREEGKTVLRFILNSGNFGRYDPSIKSSSSIYLLRKWKAFTGHMRMKFRNFQIFPEESVYGIPGFVVDGLKRTFQR